MGLEPPLRFGGGGVRAFVGAMVAGVASVSVYAQEAVPTTGDERRYATMTTVFAAPRGMSKRARLPHGLTVGREDGRYFFARR